MRNNRWIVQYECIGCNEWYDSETDADNCCEVGVDIISECQNCYLDIEDCRCDD